MTLNEARFVWKHRDWYSEDTVKMAMDVLTHAGEL